MNDESSAANTGGEKIRDLTSRYLALTLGGEPYAIPLAQVKEVIAMTNITSLPNSPAHFKGVLDLRGQVIPIIDLRSKLNLKDPRVGSDTPIVILDLAPLSLGIIVDSVDSVLAVRPEEISDNPEIGTSIKTSYLNGIVKRDKKLVLILNIRATLDLEDLSILKNQNTNKQSA
ncbi:MAG: chemotaxis protein CheW [Bdellovibrionaceae bacterium]|nr:chemotaxis protein CheW [Pseudobdellovibrionaceae bacterium]